MKNTIVIGATGTIGSAISQLLQSKGYKLIKASRHSEFRIDIEDKESINTLLSKIDSVDAIICAAGNASFGAFSKLSDEQINIGLKSKLMGQVNLCRVGLQKLNPNGVIILTGGIFAHQPWPETTNIAMVNAALEGFVRALALELTEGKRILVVHPPFVKETAEAMQMDGSQCPEASEVALTYLKGLENADNGNALFVNENHTINQ